MKKFASLLLATSVLGQGRWTLERRNIATIALGIACPDSLTCFVGASQDGVGNIIFKTTNGGQSYERARMDPDPRQMMLMSTAATSATSAVTGGMGFTTATQFTTDGDNFRNSQPYADFIAVTQNIKNVRNSRTNYGVAGDFISFGAESEGVAMSTDSGNSFTVHAVENLGAWARYATYPSDTTWYVSGGSWRNEKLKIDGQFELTSKIRIATSGEKGSKVEFSHFQAFANATEDDGYRAAIARTQDGGRTWERVFFEPAGGYYFNQIDCPSTSSCFVTGEGRAPALIMATHDAGRTWRQVWQGTPDYDLMGLEFLTDREGWACGMRLDRQNFAFITVFLHTVDGGQTWEELTMAGFFCTDMSFSSPNLGRATALSLDGVSSTLVYRA